MVLWLVDTLLQLTVGLPLRQTSGRSKVYVPCDWDDGGLGRVRWSYLHSSCWDTVSGGAQVEKPQPLINAFILYVKVRGKIGHSCAYGGGATQH